MVVVAVVVVMAVVVVVNTTNYPNAFTFNQIFYKGYGGGGHRMKMGGYG